VQQDNADPPFPDGYRAVAGETAYMAPERRQGLPEDRRSDIYSLGVVLYEQATGRRPCDGGECGPVEDLPVELTSIIARALARDPRDRYPTAELMANDLQKSLHQHHARTRRELGSSVELPLHILGRPDRHRRR
jgi:serine/threonine protein kinase